MLAHSYRLATYSDSSGRPRAGLVVDDRVIDVSTSLKLSNARFLAPIPDPGTIFCAVANYRGHVTEVSKAVDLPAEFYPYEHGLNARHIVIALWAARCAGCASREVFGRATFRV